MKKEVKKNLKKKLSLTKSTIANLSNYQMKNIYGGDTYHCKKATSYFWCGDVGNDC